jgi:uncharacterized membrane protein HdeD (DUF308 family)
MAENKTDLLDDAQVASAWWLFLVVGVLWLLFGFMLLSFSFKTVWGVAAFVGIGLLAGGTLDIIAAFSNKQGRGLNIFLGLMGIGAGIIALAWPSETFLVLARLLAWFLFISGIVGIINSFMTKSQNNLWFLSLCLGILNVTIGIWAIRYVGNSLVLLALVAGIVAISRGMMNLFSGFALHGLKNEIKHEVAAA